MPITPTYPGVYIEEVSSGVRTITGVATSITAFIGRALKGPVDDPVTINNYSDFERIFGGLWTESPMSYAVKDFYMNGGGQAVIVRIYNQPDPLKSHAKLIVDGLKFTAKYPGAWGNDLCIKVDYNVLAEAATRIGLKQSDLFNLTISIKDTSIIEYFPNCTVKESPSRVDRVLENKSKLVEIIDVLPQDIQYSAGTSHEMSVDEHDMANDGLSLDNSSFGTQGNKDGLYALEKIDLFNLLCIPPYKIGSDGDISEVDSALVDTAAKYCEDRRAMFIIDPPGDWQDINSDDIKKQFSGLNPNLFSTRSKNAAIYFPRIKQPDPLRNNQLREFAPCGAIAGIFARTDQQRGVWKAPAGNEATLNGVQALSAMLTDAENGQLNQLGINCLRFRPAAGRVIWGARTLQGDDRLTSDWKYIPVRRTALFIEETLYRGTQWVVFEPNDEPLWAQVRLNIGAFMHSLFRQGAFQGSTPKEAYLVKCDKETTTQDDINRGIINIVVGFAPLKPAEFVIIKLQQLAGQIQV
jgi:phage tail sheath protein FI